MAPPRGTIGDRRAVRGSSDVRTLRARTAGCTLGAMCFLLLMALAALVASSTITRAEAQWWRALGALLRDTEEAAPALRPAHKTVPEGVIALPKAAEAPPAAKPEVPSPSLAAPLSAAMQAAARSASRCFSSGDAKSQLDCRRLIMDHQNVLDDDRLGLTQSGVSEDGVPFSGHARIAGRDIYVAYTFGTPPNIVPMFCAASIIGNADSIAVKCGDPKRG